MDDPRLLWRFLRGDLDAPPDSWVYRENWLVWHKEFLTPKMLDKEIEKALARARGKKARPWAWESLLRLYNEFRDRGEPIPASLQLWADDVVNERLRRPKGRRKPDTARHARYRIAAAVLSKMVGMKREESIAFIAEETGEPEETVRSVLRRSS